MNKPLPQLTDYQKVQLAIGEINREIDGMNTYFRTVNTCFMALAQYMKIPAKTVAKIMSNPQLAANYENDVVTELKVLSAKKHKEVVDLKKNIK